MALLLLSAHVTWGQPASPPVVPAPIITPPGVPGPTVPPTVRPTPIVPAPVLPAPVVPTAPARPASPTATASTARGVVFEDGNGNRVRDEGERPLAGIRVSNGTTIVTTDDQGRYELPVDDDTTIFVIKPRGLMTPVNDMQLPQFYYTHKPNGSPPSRFAGVAPTGPLPESIDFPLMPQDEPETFKVLLLGDPQSRNLKEVDYLARDIVEPLIGKTDAAFGVSLGDLAFDNLDVLEPQSRMIALIGIPWYNVIGNHDLNFEADNDKHSDETFERIYGPSYYSFDYGHAHFLVLDDVMWTVHSDGKKRYEGGLGEEQLAFIKNDLALIPPDQPVVLMMHIPLMNVNDRAELFRMIEQRPTCISISAHRHTHEHHFFDEKDGWKGPVRHHHIVNVTACGSWWRGAPDERGIPHAMMSDGAPNGHSVLSFDGNHYQLDFFPASRPKDYQMEIHAPSAVVAGSVEALEIAVNVFNGSEEWTVEMDVDQKGQWTALTKVSEPDPKYQAAFDADQARQDRTYLDLPRPSLSTHLWKGTLAAERLPQPPAAMMVTVRATDADGRVFESKRSLRVIEPVAVAPRP